jgi:predicted DNA-binding protein
VRFPEPQYQRLKGWCEEHSFPMAVVVRGVVERFLDEQQVAEHESSGCRRPR